MEIGGGAVSPGARVTPFSVARTSGSEAGAGRVVAARAFALARGGDTVPAEGGVEEPRAVVAVGVCALAWGGAGRVWVAGVRGVVAVEAGGVRTVAWDMGGVTGRTGRGSSWSDRGGWAFTRGLSVLSAGPPFSADVAARARAWASVCGVVD